MDVYNMLQAIAENVEDLRQSLPVHKSLTYERRALSGVATLVVHHSDSRPDVSWNAVARYHVDHNGWPGIGYHFGIAVDGKISYLGDVTTWRYHARQANETSIGICCLGNYAASEPPGAMLESLAVLMNVLDSWFARELQRVGHRDVVDTTCPGDHLYSLIPQHKRALPLPQDEPDATAAVLAAKVRWWMEEYTRQLAVADALRANDILAGLIDAKAGLLYRLERKLQAAEDVA